MSKEPEFKFVHVVIGECLSLGDIVHVLARVDGGHRVRVRRISDSYECWLLPNQLGDKDPTPSQRDAVAAIEVYTSRLSAVVAEA